MASLPFFLFTLPVGALADNVDRKKLLCAINLWLAAIAVALAVLARLHLLNPGLILTSVFFLGVGFAFNAPTWTSIVPQVVSDTELPSAVTLSGLQFNISGVVGPVLGGLLGFVGRSEFCIYYQCRLFPLGDSVHSAMETIGPTSARGIIAT